MTKPFDATFKKDKYNSEMIGLNGRLDSIQAAVLLEKLSIFDEEIEMRNKVDLHYRKYLNNAQYHPKDYQSDFLKYAKVADMYIACHYWDTPRPNLLLVS